MVSLEAAPSAGIIPTHAKRLAIPHPLIELSVPQWVNVGDLRVERTPV